MTKQEKIREGVARQLYYWLTMAYRNEDNFNETAWEAISEKDREYYREYYAEPLMKSLHSQGVVIRVEKELPKTIPVLPKFHKQGIITDDDLLDYARVTELLNRMEYIKAGYVAVEPLIYNLGISDKGEINAANKNHNLPVM